MKDQFEVKQITEFVTLRPKAHSYLTDGNNENKMQKSQKSVS